MHLNRLSLCLGLVAAVSGCQVVDQVMGIPSGSAVNTGITDIPATTPSQPLSLTPSPQLSPAKVSSSLVIYVGSTTEVNGYTAVTQKGRTVYVDPRQTLGYTDLKNAVAVLDERNNPYVDLVFSPIGAQKLADLTSQHTGKHLIVVLNNELIAILNIDGRNNKGLLHVPMQSVLEAQTVERRILDGE